MQTYTDKFTCYFCDCKSDPSIKGFRSLVEVHHIKEKNQGGSNHISNLVPVCSNHHSLIHLGKISIEKWVLTTNGMQLIWVDHQGTKRIGKIKCESF